MIDSHSQHSQINATFDGVIGAVRDRLSRNLRIRRNLPGEGRLRLDRQLPFLCIYRTPVAGGDDGARDLVTTEAAYLFASGEPRFAEGLDALCCSISETLEEHFGALLLFEVWTEEDRAPPLQGRLSPPRFRIVAAPCDALSGALEALAAALREVTLHGAPAEVETAHDAAPAPPGMRPIAAACGHGECFRVGIAVRPVYRDATTGALFPLVLQSLRRQLATALRKAIFAFSRPQSASTRIHYESFGPSTMARTTRLVDQQLCEISQSFDFLLQATPINSEAAWKEFSESGYRTAPVFYYRPLPHHPALVKRQLFEIPIEHVEDSTLAHLFGEKQDELDSQLAALKHIDAPAFYYDSLQLYGSPDAALAELAESILNRPHDPDDEAEDVLVTADSIAAAAREQIDYYHERLPDFHAAVDVVNNIASGMMVAHDHLLVSETAAIPSRRLEPLLHHEVGAHLLTYFNGRQQPLRQLYAGLAGYEALQEGLAVLSEYFAGGLTRSRLRLLAARVLAVRARCEGASLAEAFHLLYGERQIRAKLAFMTTVRAFRGGGLTKDALYLRGLRDLLEYLKRGHDLEPLYVGKFALEHVPLVRELRRRGVVQPPALLPQFWGNDLFHSRLERCRTASVLDLLESPP